APRPVQGPEVEVEQVLVRRLLADEAGDLAYQVGMPPHAQAALDALHRGGEPLLLKGYPGAFRPVAVEPVKRDAAPERERRAVPVEGTLVVARRGCPRLVPERAEAPDVDVLAVCVQDVGARPLGQLLAGSARGAYGLAQPGHVLMERLARAVRRLVAPDPADQ